MKSWRSSRRPAPFPPAFAPVGQLLKAGLLPALLLLAPPAQGAPSWGGVYWGESAAALLRHFGSHAVRLPRPLDFGDSTAELALRDAVIAGYRVVVFFQIDKRTHGLKRIQIEWPRHSANPPAFRALLAALDAAYGPPDAVCDIQPASANGFQAAAQALWRRRGDVIRAIFLDTTIEALEGCLGVRAPPCGLVGQLLLRISPKGAETASCARG
ncbi:MAG TPA: hypothetical protein VJ770_19730 [Stellaceae bacterium]|nr:hypothetical protein [Stellaceae bacterium]